MQRIVIVGGGFAGATLARKLARGLPEGWEVLLISEESYTTCNPMLPDVVGASVFPEHVVTPLRQVIGTDRRGRFVMGRVSGIDLAQRRVTCATLGGERNFAYDHIVLACGNRARLDLIPGMAEHAAPLKTIGDALHIRNTVLRQLARMELEPDAAARARLGHFAVIGGGFSGVEVAAALADALQGAARFYRGVDAAGLRISVIQNIDRLLPELPRSLGAAAEAALRRRGVAVHLDTTAARITAAGVELGDGTCVEAGTVITTIGARANPLVEGLGLPLDRGRILVDAAMAVAGVPCVWAIGDCARVINARDGSVSPATAQFAVRQATALAANLLAAIRGDRTRPFTYHPRGMMAALGHRRGVAEIFGLRISGLPAWLLWRGYYLAQVPTLLRKLRIHVEWTWGMFFAADITHIRFTRSAELEEASAPRPTPIRAAAGGA